MELFRERTNEELFELLGVRNEPVELPKLKVSTVDLEQKIINYLYKKLCANEKLTENDIKLVNILLKEN